MSSISVQENSNHDWVRIGWRGGGGEREIQRREEREGVRGIGGFKRDEGDKAGGGEREKGEKEGERESQRRREGIEVGYEGDNGEGRREKGESGA